MIGDLASFVSALRAMALPADYSRIHLALGHHLLVAVLAALYVASLWGIGRAAGRWLGLACSRTWRRILLEFFLGRA